MKLIIAEFYLAASDYGSWYCAQWLCHTHVLLGLSKVIIIVISNNVKITAVKKGQLCNICIGAWSPETIAELLVTAGIFFLWHETDDSVWLDLWIPVSIKLNQHVFELLTWWLQKMNIGRPGTYIKNIYIL